MVKVVGVIFKEVGKIYWFNPNNLTLSIDDKVVVETIRGVELGTVVQPIRNIDEKKIEHELKPVLRLATKQDLRANENNLERAEKAIVLCKEIVAQHQLEMKLLECEYTLDRQKIIIYYNAEGRVDFRELLKDLAAAFKVRIELRQVGPREGAKFLGGIGSCGQEICCKRHLREFDLVTMRMAKEQGMTLSSAKIAGLCGKLMCCIGYENPVYQEIRSRIPLVGDLVKTPTGACCKVIGVDYLREIIKLENNEKVELWPADELIKIESHHEEEDPDDLTDDVIENGNNS
ncbi:MAG: stage 0 sporulation family protein [Bacilli bacterium]|nr:stage 0 sporulation family protein [Bacilli bacterium]MDD4076418.1 stage 0 sporulation family protein [Bacilli bacterium]MDD4387782.1 stage 0 sporulation family protein [Bacilli bacterium]